MDACFGRRVRHLAANVKNRTKRGKKLTAVYLTFGNDAVASYNNGWTFDRIFHSYYMRAEKVDYMVDTTYGITTLSATLDMVNPDGYVQFFIEDDAAVDDVYTLGTDAVIPVGLASVSADGTISETSDKTYVDDLPGYVFDNGTEKGYLFSGKLNPDSAYAGNDYFARKAGAVRHDYFVTGKTLASHSAVKLPALDSQKWVQVGPDHTVGLVRLSGQSLGTWYTCNYGASVPEEMGQYSSYSDLGITLPEVRDLWDHLAFESEMNRALLTIHGHSGFVFWGKSGFIFLPIDSEDRRYTCYFSSTEGSSEGREVLCYDSVEKGFSKRGNYTGDGAFRSVKAE